MQATGSFDVTLAPLDLHVADPTRGRMSLDKVFHGDLEASGEGEMLTAGSPNGSGVYVAIERITGALHGRRGSFAAHHVGVMTRGTPQLAIALVPDSGTGELAGIAGALAIKIVDGKHFYTLDYTLPEAP